MPIYTVTFCAMDQEAGANPFWHTCILLSRFDETIKKLEVVDNWGFYGLPTTASNSLLRRLKIKIGLDVDLTGNHGMLRHEEIRYLDLGCGLHGATFELTEDKFIELKRKCEQMAAAQTAAIEEGVKELELKPKPVEKTRIYAYEDHSAQLFKIEKAKAESKGCHSRLKNFELTPFSTAHTCKVQVLELLEDILTPQQVERLTGRHRAVSRYSGKMERIFLHSSGPIRQHVKRSGEAVHYRDGADKNVKLHWTIAPQEIETLSGETRDLFKVHEDHCDAVKKIVRQLQRVEWLFINAIFEKKYFSYRDELVHLIKTHYEVFSRILPKKANTTKSSWTNSLLWLCSLARDEDERYIMVHLHRAKQLLNSLYMAVVNNWELQEPLAVKGAEDTFYFSLTNNDDIEALAAYLPLNKKKELCKILGRSFVEPEIVGEVEEKAELVQYSRRMTF